MTDDSLYNMIHDRNNWMESATGAAREEDAYLILFNIPDGYSAGSFQGIIMYLKSERKETDSLFVSCDGDYIPANEMDKCNTTYTYGFPYTPGAIMTIVPDVVRERKIVCYDCRTSYAPLRNWLASHGNRYEISNEFVDVKEMAKDLLGQLPDYELDTILAYLGCNPSEFETDDLGTVMKIKWVYERLKVLEEIWSW